MSKLSIGDESFLIKRSIDQCSNRMMLRELVQNAIEANLTVSKKNINIFSTDYEGAQKLSVWNTGTGMDEHELRKACDLSSSIRKTNAMDENFGIGAKVASLAVNKLGLRFRSCKNGKACEVLMGEQKNLNGEEEYVRIDYEDASKTKTQYEDVADVSHLYDDDELKFDWTEVVLYGNKEKQNTVLDPFDGNPKVSKNWIAKSLYHRFYRLPEGIKIILSNEVNKKGGNREFRPFPEILKIANKEHPDKVMFETVSLADQNIKIHYSYDSKGSANNNITYNYTLTSDVTFSGVIYKNEIYDLRESNKWYHTAPSLGIPFGSKNICILVELSDEAKVGPDQYRENIRWDDSEKANVSIDYFQEVIYKNRPQWLIDKIKEHSPQSDDSDQVKKQLEDLIKNLSLLNNRNMINKNGSQKSKIGEDGPKVPVSRSTDKKRDPNIEKKLRRPITQLDGDVSISKELLQVDVPEFHILRTDEELKEHPSIINRAALYYETTNIVYINFKYNSSLDMIAALEKEYGNYNDQELMKKTVDKAVGDFFKLLLGRSIIWCLIKRKTDGWSTEDVADALKPSTFSIICDDWIAHLDKVKKSLGVIFKDKKVA